MGLHISNTEVQGDPVGQNLEDQPFQRATLTSTHLSLHLHFLPKILHIASATVHTVSTVKTTSQQTSVTIGDKQYSSKVAMGTITVKR